MVLFWARTPCSSMQPNLDKSERSDNQNRTNIRYADIINILNDNNLMIRRGISEGQVLTGREEELGMEESN